VSGYWPFWAGALALAAVTVGFPMLARQWFGVSGSWRRTLEWRQRRRLLAEERRLAEEPDALAAALAAATCEEFGLSADDSPMPTPMPMPRSVSPSQDVWLLGAILVGALVDRLLSPTHAATLDVAPLSLVAGGLLVGFGTRMAGGCTSGHGLTGIARLRPVSMLAVATFFGAGIATSFILEALR
jgi:hypothetical protein